MFGYIMVNKPELKFREFDEYKSFYCGLCRQLKSMYGFQGQMTLSYDCTFIVMLLTGVYEPNTAVKDVRCVIHPVHKHQIRINEYSAYAAKMNILLSYYKCEDDWNDDKKLSAKSGKMLLKSAYKDVCKQYPDKASFMKDYMGRISKCEMDGVKDIDMLSGYFGDIMAQIFVYRKDEWEEDLKKMGFFMGKFIYLLDAYEDIYDDMKKGNFNPFSDIYKDTDFDDKIKKILTMMMSEAAKAFERMPIIQAAPILRNVIYSGVWCRYDMVRNRREGQ